MRIKDALWLLLFLCLSSFSSDLRAESGDWQRVSDGLYLGQFSWSEKAGLLDHPITILKIDPKMYSLRLLCASEYGGTPRTTKQWCLEFGLLAAINASMYRQQDPLKSTGYMINYLHVNNSHINPAFGAFMVFNPVSSSLPEVQIIDRYVQENWRDTIGRYHSVVQNYRMISNGKKMGWPQQDKIYRTAAIGLDRDGRILFILSRSPYSTHDFIHGLLSLPIGIRDAMYVEGGVEASLYYRISGKETEMHARETEKNFTATDHDSAWAVPNVIGVVKRGETPGAALNPSLPKR